MLSVYYHSIGRRFEIRGAPAVLLPPEVQPQSLAVALATLRRSPDKTRMRQAMWTIARAVGPARGTPPPRGSALLHAYPPELVEALRPGEYDALKRFERKRGRFRREAHLFAAALVVYVVDGGRSLDTFRTIVGLFGAAGRDVNGFNMTAQRTDILAGMSAEEFLQGLLEHPDHAAMARSLSRLEQEVGLTLPTFVEEFADSVAFAECFPGGKREELTVFPTSSVTLQDAESLLTRVTVTALVRTDNFHCLRIGMDPQCWSTCSQAFVSSGYLADALKDGPPNPAPVPGYYGWHGPAPKLLEEKVTICWGEDPSRVASFHNILNIRQFDICDADKRIDLAFDLNRCITSRLLWDERAGGILVDEGYAKARRLGPGLWRLTVRKTIRFSDRTPYAGGTGLNDFGELINYLTPAMLSWWIESELYSATCPSIIAMAKQQRAAETPSPPSPQADADASADAAAAHIDASDAAPEEESP
ncbi:MAG: hypothetical protein QOG42_1742 [Solirubrobacteraceae bacterium]|nr:hypothetical protein [Solirubrobacteraceae bacterium]